MIFDRFIGQCISVIVPVYNAAPYLERCLLSICQQTYRNLEIICVDDGSNDGAAEILDHMALQDSRICVVHQMNHGESHARNVGIDMAHGHWLAFVDNDDWLELGMYDSLVKVGKKQDIDMVCSSWVKEDPQNSQEACNKLLVKSGVFGRDALLGYIYRRDDYQGFAYMWNKLYKRELFSGVKFDENLRVGGDVLALAEVSLRARRATYIDKSFYHYRQRTDSGCHTNDANVLMDWVVAYDRVIELFEQASVSDDTMIYVKRFAAYTASRAARAALVSRDHVIHQKAVAAMSRYQAEYEETNRIYPDRIREFRKRWSGGLGNEMEESRA